MNYSDDIKEVDYDAVNYPADKRYPRFTFIQLSSRAVLILFVFDLTRLGTRIALICYRSQ